MTQSFPYIDSDQQPIASGSKRARDDEEDTSAGRPKRVRTLDDPTVVPAAVTVSYG